VGWKPKEIFIEAPAIVRGQSYHLETEAPEGLEITTARLITTDLLSGAPGPDYSVLHKAQRAHVYLSNVPQGASGTAEITLRPRASTIVRGATLTGAFTVLVLVALALFWEPTEAGGQSAMPSLLLVVPSLLSAYVARPREPSVTTAVLFGLRIIALLPAVCAFGAAAIIVLGRTCTTSKTGDHCDAWWGAEPALWLLAGVALATTVVLAATWTLIWRPPEQSHGREPK
jgi:hypothetical protein